MIEYSYKIIFPSSGHSRAREVVHKSNCGHPRKFPSLKCRKMFHLESGPERDRATIHEIDPSVIYFQEQPFKFEYEMDGKIRCFFPDFIVHRDDGAIVVEEVKPASKVAENKQRFDIERRAFEQMGWEFKVVTEAEMAQDSRLENSKKLLKYRRNINSTVLRELVLELLRKESQTGRELIRQISDLSEKKLLTLQSHGFISADLSSPLTLDSRYVASNRLPQMTLQQLRIFERTCI